MGSVCRALDNELNRRVALKIIRLGPRSVTVEEAKRRVAALACPGS